MSDIRIRITYFLVLLISASALGYIGHPEIARTPLRFAGEIALFIIMVTSLFSLVGAVVKENAE